MTTKELLAIVKDRGLSLKLSEGRPVIVQKNGGLTDALLKVLKRHRDRIIAMLEQEKSA